MSVYHLIQSEYAADFLRKKGINEDKLVWLSDYISDTYLSIQSSPENKKNAILYNPQKGYENIEPLIEKIKYAEWIPLKNLSEAEMIEKMKAAKIYIDFGKHPGKDRIPRETAICGCCVITNKCGSAAFEGDVPIGEEYKFENQKDIDAIEKMIRSIFDEYLKHYEKFEPYRDFIRQEKEYFDGMQNVCKKIFPDWKENPFMKRIPHEVVEVLNGINSTFTSQEELNKYVFDSAKKL